MKKKYLIAAAVALAASAAFAFAQSRCVGCNGTGWFDIGGNAVIKCNRCGGDGVTGN